MSRKLTFKEYKDRCIDLGVNIPLEYKGANTKSKHICRGCGIIFDQSPSHNYARKLCSKCGHKKTSLKCKGQKRTSKLLRNKRKSPEEYMQECKERGYDLPLEDYIKATIKINHKCEKCGNVYEQRPDDHLHGRGCPVCNESHGEKYIRNYLDEHNIKYIPQKRFKDLKDKTYLSYDFYLPNNNILIEYQGIQHYESINIKGIGKYSDLEKQQYHDNLKREYAKNNGYKLLELKYTLDTQELVNKYLSRRIKD